MTYSELHTQISNSAAIFGTLFLVAIPLIIIAADKIHKWDDK